MWSRGSQKCTGDVNRKTNNINKHCTRVAVSIQSSTTTRLVITVEHRPSCHLLTSRNYSNHHSKRNSLAVRSVRVTSSIPSHSRTSHHHHKQSKRPRPTSMSFCLSPRSLLTSPYPYPHPSPRCSPIPVRAVASVWSTLVPSSCPQ